ncbi:MAG: YggT family protein [Kiritimatiellae bacterium]|nr:YggT family protein [Kiritimatiellia bacterium]
MNFSTWDTLFNLLLIAFWFRIWTDDEDRNVHFNPYLAPIARLSRTVLRFVEPVFLGLRPRVVAVIAIGLIITFRALVAPRQAVWMLTLGLDRQPLDGALPHVIAFSALSFGCFLFRLWGISLLFTWVGAHRSQEHPVSMLHYLARPFSDVRIDLRPLFLLLYGAALIILLDRFGAPVRMGFGLPGTLVWSGAEAVPSFLKLVVLAIAAWVQLLPLLQSLMLMLIIGSWISMFTHSQGLALLCRDWINLLLGPLRRYPIRVGMFDLSPIVFFFVIGLAHALFMSIIVAGYNALA